MQILRHAQFPITMEIYTQVSSQATRDALKRLGEASTDEPLLYLAAVRVGGRCPPTRQHAGTAGLRKRVGRASGTE